MRMPRPIAGRGIEGAPRGPFGAAGGVDGAGRCGACRDDGRGRGRGGRVCAGASVRRGCLGSCRPRADGSYVDPAEAGWDVVEEAVAPFLGDLNRRVALGRRAQATTICQGILLGLYHVSEREDRAARYVVRLAKNGPSAAVPRLANAAAREQLALAGRTAFHVAARNMELTRDDGAVGARMVRARPASPFGSVAKARQGLAVDHHGGLMLGRLDLFRPGRHDAPAPKDPDQLASVGIALQEMPRFGTGSGVWARSVGRIRMRRNGGQKFTAHRSLACATTSPSASTRMSRPFPEGTSTAAADWPEALVCLREDDDRGPPFIQGIAVAFQSTSI